MDFAKKYSNQNDEEEQTDKYVPTNYAEHIRQRQLGIDPNAPNTGGMTNPLARAGLGAAPVRYIFDRAYRELYPTR